jgi:hypothetical protein
VRGRPCDADALWRRLAVAVRDGPGHSGRSERARRVVQPYLRRSDGPSGGSGGKSAAAQLNI